MCTGKSKPASSPALDDLREPGPRKPRTALGHKHMATVRPIAAQLPQCPDFVAVERCVDGTPFFFRLTWIRPPRRSIWSHRSSHSSETRKPCRAVIRIANALRCPYRPRARAALTNISTSADVRCSRVRTSVFFGRPTRRPSLDTVRKTGFEPSLIALPLTADPLAYRNALSAQWMKCGQ